MFKNPFTSVQPWIGQILYAIKKDIKTDHLTVDRKFYKQHFGSRPYNKLTIDEIFAVYERELLSGNEELVEWVVNRWVFKHGDVYHSFAEQLSAINPNFQEIQTLSDSQSEQVLISVAALSKTEVYLFAHLNGVVFSESIFERLKSAAMAEMEEEKIRKERTNAKESLEQILERHKREVSRLQEKYEDKLAGVQRKYQTDIAALKNQIRALQKK